MLEASTKKWLGILAAVAGGGIIVGGIVYAVKHSEKNLAKLDYRKESKKFITEKRKTADGTVTVYRGNIPIRERIGIIQEMIALSVKDPAVIKLARQVTRNCPDRDKACELKAIYDWKKRHLRYVSDHAPHKLSKADGGKIDSVDFYATARHIIESGAADCDEHVIVGCAMAIIVGIPCELEVFAPFVALGENYEHIAERGLIDNKPLYIDSTVPGNFFGIMPPHAKKLGMKAVA